MTLEELMRARSGEWQDDRAVIQAHDGYYWVVAKRTAGGVEITRDGMRFGLAVPEATPPAPPAPPPSPARGRRVSVSPLTSGLDE